MRKRFVHTIATLIATFAMANAALGISPVEVSVLEDGGNHTTIQYTIGEFNTESVSIDGSKYVKIKLAGESVMKEEAGSPELPHICRSIIIPGNALMQATVTSSKYYDIENVDVAPSKGFISRAVNPNDVPYSFGTVYEKDAFYPNQVASLREPYILRDHRGIVVKVHPFQYNPVTHTLRVYTDLTVQVAQVGLDDRNVLSDQVSRPSASFETIYTHHFLNHSPALRYAPLDEDGDMLIICHDAWLTNVQPLVNHKNSRGINTTAVGVSTIGNNSTSIKSYIQNAYNSGNLAFVLLVGDADEVDTPYSSGGSSDPSYSLLAGSDNYPEIMVGRFSAETAAQVDTQVLRTIEYETMPAPTQDWFMRGTGVASNLGPGDDDEYDNEHLDNIRTDLLGYGYTVVDQIYDPTASASQVTTVLNAGRGVVNYTGHGSETSWSSSGFSNTHVNALTNDNMLPFLFSVACLNGRFDGYTCFAESWLRATHGSEPTGAIGAYMSSVNQSWEPPMCAQDEFADLLVAEAYSSFGTLCYAASCQMVDEYGSGGVTVFETWHVFGDPSLRVVMTCVDAGVVSFDQAKYACESVATISINDCGLNLNDGSVDTTSITITSDSDPIGETVVLTETDPASATFVGTVSLSKTDSPGSLLVTEDDTVTATYNDADDGTGAAAVVTETVTVDCTMPTISNVQAAEVEPRSAIIEFDCDEPARGIVHYGLSCGSLTETSVGSGHATDVLISLSGLVDNTTYYYSVEAEDEAGNTSTDDNGGACYSFSTPEVPDFFTEIFESDDNDLDNWSLKFTPNGSNDFYGSCSEEIVDGNLPTDPSGGVNLSFGDDEYKTVNLTGGATVSLYGTSYSTFYPCSNGYICFVHGEDGYTESLSAHLGGIPRISALFDDLDPRDGGTISWKQMSDRVAVTWEDIEEHSESTTNTFQIVMYFNGDIELNYLDIAASDGLAGLSEGSGIDPDFMESDLTNMGNCGPKPPRATNSSETTACEISMTVSLQATDDGLPEDPGVMTYIIESLPTEGQLIDPKAGTVTSVPYSIADGSNQINYAPKPGFEGIDSFDFKVNDGGIAPDGGDSNTATVSITVGGSAWNPTAINVNVSMSVNESKTVTLVGTDPNGDQLTYSIESLPVRGLLNEPGYGFITAVPHELAANGRTVTYVPPCGESFSTPDTFTYSVADATASSDEATVAATVIAGGPRVVYSFNMDTDPGWTTEGYWAYGTPMGLGSHHQDPTAGYTGSNVYGYNLYGDYQNNKPTYSLTSEALNCSSLSETELRFRRWLGVEYEDDATVEVSANGVDWTVIWDNKDEGDDVNEENWSLQSYDISAVADGEEAVQIRWTMGETDYSTSFPGWNIDDVEIVALVPLMDADFDGDGLVDLSDFALLEACLDGPEADATLECICIDLDADGDVDLADFAAFQESMTE